MILSPVGCWDGTTERGSAATGLTPNLRRCKIIGWRVLGNDPIQAAIYASNIAAELGVDITPRFKVLKVSEPPRRGGGVKVASVSELLDKLKADGVLS